jgi:hypothetical protein
VAGATRVIHPGKCGGSSVEDLKWGRDAMYDPGGPKEHQRVLRCRWRPSPRQPAASPRPRACAACPQLLALAPSLRTRCPMSSRVQRRGSPAQAAPPVFFFLDCGAADASALKSRLEISPRLYPAAAFAMIKAKAVTYMRMRKCLRCWFMIARLRRFLRPRKPHFATKEQQQCWRGAISGAGARHVIIARAAPRPRA